MAEQLPLFTLLNPLPTIIFNPPRCYNWLNPEQEHLLTYIILKNGRMIPPDSVNPKTITSLKALGLVRDGLEVGLIEITAAGNDLMCQWFKYLKASGQMWSC